MVELPAVIKVPSLFLKTSFGFRQLTLPSACFAGTDQIVIKGNAWECRMKGEKCHKQRWYLLSLPVE